MKLQLESLTGQKRDDFLDYFRRPRTDHDDSYLPQHDLAALDPPGQEHVVALPRDEEGRVRGAAAR